MAPPLASPATLPGTGLRWPWLQRAATAALFLLPALALAVPVNLLPFALLFLASSVLGIDYLWRARRQAAGWAGLLAMVAVLVVVAGAFSAWQSDARLRDAGKVARLLAMPWAMLWVCALRPRMQALWWGAWAGLLATLAVAGGQVLAGQPRADGWTNAIVLADVALVLMVLLVFCRPSGRWSWVMTGMVAGSGVILLSGSRGVWPALFALLLAMAGSVRWGSGRIRLALLGAMVLLATLLLLVVPGLRDHARLTELHSDVQRLEQGDANSSAGARVELLGLAWGTFRAKPWTGVGIGQFDRAVQRLPACAQDVAGRESTCRLGHAHNDLAEWAATQGIPGVLLLLLVYGVPLAMFVRLYRRRGTPGFRGPAAAGMLLVVAYVLCGLTQSMFAHQLSASVYALLVGVLGGFSVTVKRGSDSGTIVSPE